MDRPTIACYFKPSVILIYLAKVKPWGNTAIRMWRRRISIKPVSQVSICIFVIILATVIVAASTPASGIIQRRSRASSKPAINKKNLQELMRAAEVGNVARVNALLNKGIDVNVTYLRNESRWSGKTALMVAAEHGQTEVIWTLVRRKADVNLKHYADVTALMLAAGGGHVEAVKELLAAGADPNAVGFYFHYGDFAPLMFAIRSKSANKLDVIDALIAGGAELNSKKTIRTPLMAAIENDDPDMIEALVKRGAEVNARGPSDTTPLMLAAIGGTPRVIQALLDAGADVNLRDKEGRTALAFAEQDEKGLWKDEILELLKRAGAKP